jgi:hypothetical protein
MSAAGLCEVCNQPDVDHTCDRCGQLVCDRHFDEEQGACIKCVADLGRPDEVREPGGEDMPDGVDTYQF